MEISIAGLDKAELLAAFFNASRPMGMGVLQAVYGPTVMTREDALRIFDEGTTDYPHMPNINGPNTNLYFDYVYGRPLKINLKEDTMSTALFDRDNGEGRGQEVINSVRLSTALTF